MFELGEYANEEHKKIVELIESRKINHVILIGPEFCKAAKNNFKTFTGTNEALEYLKQHPQKNKTILIKGSRGMKLEILKDVL